MSTRTDAKLGTRPATDQYGSPTATLRLVPIVIVGRDKLIPTIANSRWKRDPAGPPSLSPPGRSSVMVVDTAWKTTARGRSAAERVWHHRQLWVTGIHSQGSASTIALLTCLRAAARG